MFKPFFTVLAAALLFIGCSTQEDKYLYSLNVGGKGETISTELATNGMFLVHVTNAPDNNAFALSFTEPVFTLKDEEADEVAEWLDKWFEKNFAYKFEKDGVAYNAAIEGVVVDEENGIKVIIDRKYGNNDEEYIEDRD